MRLSVLCLLVSAALGQAQMPQPGRLFKFGDYCAPRDVLVPYSPAPGTERYRPQREQTVRPRHLRLIIAAALLAGAAVSVWAGTAKHESGAALTFGGQPTGSTQIFCCIGGYRGMPPPVMPVRHERRRFPPK